MGATITFCSLFLLILISVSGADSAKVCDRCAHQSNASYFPLGFNYSSGACGYGPMAIVFNKGYLASVAPSLYKNGAACGACFQIRCKDQALCSSKGVSVIVTHSHSSNETGFVLSREAYIHLAKPGTGGEVLKQKIRDLEYKRVPCDVSPIPYGVSQNLTLRVEESSSYPDYLAIQILNQGGQTEIVAIEMFGPDVRYMTRKRGAVWGASLLRPTALYFRFLIKDDRSSSYWIWAERPIPAYWEQG